MVGGCPTGSAKLTEGYELLARFVIHAVGPVWRGGDEGEDELLASCYRKAMPLAEKSIGSTRLHFPASAPGLMVSHSSGPAALP